MKIIKTITLLAVGTLFSAASLHAETLQPEPATRTTLPELSKSIVAEAQSQRPSGASGTLATLLASSVSTGSRANPEGSATSQGQLNAPNVAGMLPSVPLALADGAVNGSLSTGSTNLHYRDNSTFVSLNLGLGYLKDQNAGSALAGKVELATLPASNLALGSTISLTDKTRRDLVLNAIWQLPDSGLRFKATGGYLWGNQTFDFVSGAANVNIEQFGYVLSTEYIIPKSDDLNCLHSIGLSLWGARANQTSNGDGTRYFTVDAADYYLIKNDPLALSEGRLCGASADTQIAILSNLVAKGSVGYEQLRFPFAEGTSELNRSAYYNVDFLYELIPDVTFGAGYRSGAGEDRINASATAGNWQLSAFQNTGQNGVAYNRGVMLSFHLGASAGKPQGSLARRMQPSRTSDRRALLAAATTRPVQLPQSFLAKVDRSAVTEVAKVSKNVPAGTTVNSDGDVFVTVGTGAPVITGITQNGTSVTYATTITTTTTQLVIHTRQLPAAQAGGDTYLISVTDGASTPYTVTVIID
ncbi:MAG: hypothetical protein WCH05_03985 [Chlorobiaceae bacterium]